MDPRLKPAAWPAATVVGVLLAFAPAVVGLRTLSQRDTERLYAPVRTLVVEELRAGRLPLWNPYEATGKPLFAEGIHSVLHPISLLGAALAPSSIDFLILTYLVTAALGAFLLARTLDASPPASAGAGLAFALSGYSVSMTGNLVFLAGLSTLPWVVASARNAGAGSRWGPVSTALATACAFFSGDVQIALVGLALGTLLAADAGGPRGLARALPGMAAGVLLAAVQIVPTHALLPFTLRSSALPDLDRTWWSLQPARLLEWIIPSLFRGPLAASPVGRYGAWLDPVFAESVYLGAPLLVVAGLGALRKRRRTGLLLGGAAAALLWLAFGHYMGARQLLDWVPVWSRFRYSEKLMAPLTLCLCALGALGIDSFAAERFSRSLTRGLTLAAVTAGAVLLAVLIAPTSSVELSVHLFGDAGSYYQSRLATGLSHVLAAICALLALDLAHSETARVASLALLVALVPATAVYFGAHLGAHEARRFVTPMRLDSDSPAPRIAHPAVRAFSPEQGLDHIEVAATSLSRLLVPALNVAYRVDDVTFNGAFEPRRYAGVMSSFGDEWARDWRRFGLTHVVIPLPQNVMQRDAVALATDGGRLDQRSDALGFELWAVPHRPWAFFAERALATELPGDAHEIVTALIARAADTTVVVETGEPPTTGPGRVLHIERRSESLVIDAESEAPALLVVQDAFWPGWRASIDGKPTTILAADGLVRAVRWPAGRHRLEMVYDPPELRVGLALSALGAAFVLLLAALAARRATPAPGSSSGGMIQVRNCTTQILPDARQSSRS